jgi:hypothetical protein
MKKILIRKGVFETNSSSAHSVSIADETKEFVLDALYPDQNGNILLTGGEFGWDWFKHNDALTKANYAAQAFNNNGNDMEMLVDVIKEMTGAEEVLFDCEDGYIDHDSYGTAPTNREDLKNFIFNKNSWLFGGNDNSTADPTFYHVPEFKAGRMILPEYKYELKIEGYGKTTKFLKKPTIEDLENGLDAILSGVKLYDRGNGLYFDDDNSIYAQIHRSNDYFEFRCLRGSGIDTKNQEITFMRETWGTARDIYMSTPESKTEDWSKVGYHKVSEIEKSLITERATEFVRKVKYSLTKIEKKKPTKKAKK